MDIRLLPFCASVISALSLALQHFIEQSTTARDEQPRKYYDRVTFLYHSARLVSCILLAILAIPFAQDLITQSLSATFIYTSILATLPLLKRRDFTNRHLNAILLTTLIIYLYRDVFPLATFDRIPEDAHEGYLLWIKIIVLAFSSLGLPPFTPRAYIALDPEVWVSKHNEERSASPFSLLTFSYLNGIIHDACRVPRLTEDMLPPLTVDETAHRLRDTFERVYSRQRHIFFSLMRAFYLEYIEMIVLLVFHAAAPLIAPLALNRLLEFLETSGQNATMRPWFWVMLLFLGPISAAACMERIMILNMRVMVLGESLITQIICEHSLRIRDRALGNISEDQGQHKGRIINLITSDMQTILSGRNYIFLLTYSPVKLGLSIWFLSRILGVLSASAGVALVLISLPISLWITKMIHSVQATQMQRADARVQIVTEAMSVTRMIKLFGWESKMIGTISERREEELVWVKKHAILVFLNQTLNFATPIMSMLATYATFIVLTKQNLMASVVFSSIAVFSSLRNNFSFVFAVLNETMNAKVSLDRVNGFLHKTELLDSEVSRDPLDLDIGFRNATFVWTRDDAVAESRAFSLELSDVSFKRGCINLVTGPVGSGKTSLLMALLGEIHFIPTKPDSSFRLPRQNGIAYVSQEPWILNETIRDNILFGSSFNEGRYNTVLKQCCLEPDLALFEAGDNTEVGERGLTLSGGQKARIALARAVYSQAEIVLLDDPLAALDAHTTKEIVRNCLVGSLMAGRTIILVTHNVLLLRHSVGFAVYLEDGRVLRQGSADAVLTLDSTPERLEHEKPDAERHESKITYVSDKSSSGKLIAEEETEVGRIAWSALKMYIDSFGGGTPLFFIALLLSHFIVATLSAIQTWFIGYWVSKSQQSDTKVFWYLSVYGSLSLATVFAFSLSSFFNIKGSIAASRRLHAQLISSVIRATFRWLDTTPVSRVMTRCTRDINSVDLNIPRFIPDGLTIAIPALVQLCAVIFFVPLSLGPGILAILASLWVRDTYMNAQLSVKRSMEVSKAPIVGHIQALITGLVSVRAYGAQKRFLHDNRVHIDSYTRIARTFYGIDRWMALRIEVLAAFFSTTVAAYVMYFGNQSVFEAGFSLNMTVTFSGAIIWVVLYLNAFETECNALERIKEYTCIEQEPGPTKAGRPPAYWPASGSLCVDKLSAKYSPSGPDVLHDISFNVQSGERIGVVGRTGSGKSTLMLALLRCIPTRGTVVYDGIPMSSLNLDALRSNITTIPQMPELLSGTLRYNLDPFQQHDDATLNNALVAVGLLGSQGTNRLNLDSGISGRGENLSVGERQLLAIARAIIRESKLLILDEATSAIDYETDHMIQASLRRNLRSDATVITIAHRLQTIMDSDKILVLDAGRMVEFDTPEKLLQKRDGYFRALVAETGDQRVAAGMFD